MEFFISYQLHTKMRFIIKSISNIVAGVCLMPAQRRLSISEVIAGHVGKRLVLIVHIEDFMPACPVTVNF